MGKVKNNKTQWNWEFLDRRGNLRHLGNWYKKYKKKRTTDTKHKKKYVYNDCVRRVLMHFIRC